MTTVLMVGGPLHGRTQQMPDPLPDQWLVPRPVEFSPFEPDDGTITEPESYRYELRWYDGRPPSAFHAERMPAYLCVNTDKAEHIPAPRNEDEAFYAYAAKALWHHTIEARLPKCAVPGCADKGRCTFTAAENGRLAGRDWQRGDKIRVCYEHARDIYLVAGAYGMHRLPGWMRSGAMWDPLDAYHAGGSAYGAEYLERTARMLRVKIPARGEGEEQ